MSTELGRRLHEAASGAPPSLHATGLWERGVRRHRSRRAAGILGAVVVLAVVGGLGLQVSGSGELAPAPASPTGTGHLPRTVHEPAPWSAGTSTAGEIGPLAAVGSADRKRATGFASMVAYTSFFGVSAVDGTVRFLDLPSGARADMPGEGLNAALSPDGRRVVFARYDGSDRDVTGSEELVGWSVYDTVTGEVVELDPGTRPISQETLDPVFSSDSRTVLVAFAPGGNTDGTADSLVAFDAVTGERAVLEEPGEYWLPNVGSGPDGPVWSRERTTYTRDRETGRTTTTRTAHDVVQASFAPSGTAFAYVGGTMGPDGIDAPWNLYVGPSPEQVRKVADVRDPSQILGWRDADQVVVAVTDRDYAVVDVNDGSVRTGRISGAVNLAAPMLAADLWAEDLVAGVVPPGASDPRLLNRWFLPGLGTVLLGGFGLLVLRRRRA